MVERARDGDGMESLWAELAVWAGDRRADEAGRSRARQAWLRRQSAEGATLTGLLIDLAEHGVDVVIDLGAGDHSARGRIRAVGADFAALTAASGETSLVAQRAIVAVRAVGLPEPDGDRAPPLRTTLGDALSLLGADGQSVRLVLAPTGRTVAGRLGAVGVELVSVRLPADPPTTVAVPLAAIALCQLG